MPDYAQIHVVHHPAHGEVPGAVSVSRESHVQFRVDAGEPEGAMHLLIGIDRADDGGSSLVAEGEAKGRDGRPIANVLIEIFEPAAIARVLAHLIEALQQVPAIRCELERAVRQQAFTLAQARALGPSHESLREWTGEEIEAAAADDPHTPTDEQLAQARPAHEVMKELLGDPDYDPSKLIFEAEA